MNNMKKVIETFELDMWDPQRRLFVNTSLIKIIDRAYIMPAFKLTQLPDNDVDVRCRPYMGFSYHYNLKLIHAIIDISNSDEFFHFMAYDGCERYLDAYKEEFKHLYKITKDITIPVKQLYLDSYTIIDLMEIDEAFLK